MPLEKGGTGRGRLKMLFFKKGPTSGADKVDIVPAAQRTVRPDHFAVLGGLHVPGHNAVGPGVERGLQGENVTA